MINNEYHGDAIGQHDIYANEENTGLVPAFSYTREVGIRDDWCIDSDSTNFFAMGDCAISHVDGWQV
jgi:hypothetical protein